MRHLWACALLAVACSSVTSQYGKVAEKDSVKDYRAFLRRHPGSQYEEVARRRLDDLLFVQAREEGTPGAFRSYLESSVLSYHMREADSLLQRAVLQEKAEALVDSLARNRNGDLLLILGETLLRLGEGRRAAPYFREADSLGLDPFVVHLGLARSHSLLGEDTRATAEFQEALTLKPRSAQVYRCLAQHHRSRGQFTRALSAHLEAVERSPDDVDLRFELGLIYLDVPNPAEAIREFKGVAESDPERIEARYWVGIAYAEMGDSDLAVVWLRRYLQLVRELGDQGAVERTEAKIQRIRPATATTQPKVIPGQTYKNQEKKQQQKSSQRSWGKSPWGTGRRRRGGDPWDR